MDAFDRALAAENRRERERRAVPFNPYRAALERPPRRTGRTYRDPTGSRATGKARKDDPDGAIARARAARRALLEERQR